MKGIALVATYDSLIRLSWDPQSINAAAVERLPSGREISRSISRSGAYSGRIRARGRKRLVDTVDTVMERGRG